MFKSAFHASLASDPADLDLEAFARAVEAGEVTIVDVREPHEFAAGHIPDAVSLPLSRFEPRDLPAPADKAVVLVCQAGGRSRNALNKARAAGRTDLRHYAGGMTQWRMYGGDVVV